MCGRYTVLTEDEIIEIREILKDLSLRIARDDFAAYAEEPGEVFPGDTAPVITRNGDGLVFESVKWGFKKWSGAGVIINARAETAARKSTFSKLIETGRCVVPAGEFFEWEKVADGKKKYYAKDANGNLLFMAGLYRDRNGEREFVILTGEATGEMAKIHDRVPVILRTDQIEGWLTGAITPESLLAFEYPLIVSPCGDEPEQIRLF